MRMEEGGSERVKVHVRRDLHTHAHTHTTPRHPLRVGNKRNNNIGRMSRRGSLKKRNRLTQEQKVRTA